MPNYIIKKITPLAKLFSKRRILRLLIALISDILNGLSG